MRVLVVANLYPTLEEPSFGTFVKSQVDDLKEAGIEIDILFIYGRKSRLNYIWGIFRLWNCLLNDEYDLIHCHYIFSGLIGRLQWKHPVVLTHHGPEVFGVKGYWVAKLIRFTHSWFDRVIVVNQAQKEVLNDASIALIPCGINFKEMRLIPQNEAWLHLNLPSNKKLVLWAGEYWRPEKRFYLVEEAMILVQEQLPDVELVLVSGQPHSIIPYYMNACDVLALTSTSEGSPMVIKEAMACNLPIVSTNVGDVSEVIRGVEGCYLCEPTAEDVAHKLMKALSWGKRTMGRQRIQYLSSERIAQKVIEVYRSTLSPKSRGSVLKIV